MTLHLGVSNFLKSLVSNFPGSCSLAKSRNYHSIPLADSYWKLSVLCGAQKKTLIPYTPLKKSTPLYLNFWIKRYIPFYHFKHICWQIEFHPVSGNIQIGYIWSQMTWGMQAPDKRVFKIYICDVNNFNIDWRRLSLLWLRFPGEAFWFLFICIEKYTS